MNELNVTKDLANKTLTMERDFNAPKDKVWQAYTDQTTFEKWWGPEGWETTVKEFNFTPGGRVHYGMHCIDKNQGEWYDQWSWGVMDITEIDDTNSFSYVDYFSDETGVLNTEMPTLSIINKFVEEDDTTTLISHSRAESADQIEQLLEMGMIEGFTSQLRKLDQLLAE